MESQIAKAVGGVFIKEFKARKRKALLEKIEGGEIQLDSHEAKSDEFLSSYLVTEELVSKVHSKSKYDLLVRTFMSNTSKKLIFEEPEQYQMVLGILGELSEIEIKVLFEFYKYEITFGKLREVSDDVNHQTSYLSSNSNLNKSMCNSIIQRLKSKGLILNLNEITGAVGTSLAKTNLFALSPIADQMKKWVLDEIEKF